MSWTPRSVAARGMEVVRQEGPRSLWFEVWGELCYRRLGVFELPLDAPSPELRHAADTGDAGASS